MRYHRAEGWGILVDKPTLIFLMTFQGGGGICENVVNKTLSRKFTDFDGFPMWIFFKEKDRILLIGKKFKHIMNFVCFFFILNIQAS